MTRPWRITLKTLAVLVLILVVAGVAGWFYLRSVLVDFEGEYARKPDLKEVTVDGYAFTDRNANGELDIYEDPRRSIQERVDDLLQRMTLEEKIHLLKGSGVGMALGESEPGEGVPGAAGTIVGTPRLGIPAVYLSDGPAGLRIEPRREGEDRTYYCTAFPIATLLASSWDTDLLEEVGEAMGSEAKAYGVDVILAPGANIHRNPLCGRNFEYYSEDPLLSGYMGAAMVNGIESNGVGTSVKHFVANNQETNRNNNDVIISERALREIYLKGFEHIVNRSQPWTIMSSYNKVNGTYTSESRELLTDVLRDDWGFEGLVMTDWYGGNDAPAQIKAGNDLLEPGTKNQWKALQEAAESGELSEEEIDIAVRRILRLVLQTRKMEGIQPGNNPDLEKNARVTRRSAAQGMVLLKNENVLPLQAGANLALLGVTSFDMITGGTGSGDVNEAYIVSLEEGLKNAGFTINETSDSLFRAHRANYEDEFERPEGLAAMMNPYDPPEIDYSNEQLEELAAGSDAAILTIGRNSGEGSDRVKENDFLLTDQEKDMITRTAAAFQAAGKPLVVVLNIGGVIETASWKDQPDAILLAWQAGQESGNSVADVLSGVVNPGGKLPMTFPVQLEDHASTENFPLSGKPLGMMDFFSSGEVKDEEDKIRNEDYTVYEEGIYVGYRHFDKADLEVSYPFGYGLSYTDFEYSGLEVENTGDTVLISAVVRNSGDVAGSEVVQVYVSRDDSSVDRPVKELRGFTRTASLVPGDSSRVTIHIPVDELRYWDEGRSGWVLEAGPYQVLVGASSRDIRLSGELLGRE